MLAKIFMRALRANLLALLAFARFARAKRVGGGAINLGKKVQGGGGVKKGPKKSPGGSNIFFRLCLEKI
jgi:hypothetical protein